MIDAATDINDLRVPPGNRLEVIGKASTAFALTVIGASVSPGAKMMRMM